MGQTVPRPDHVPVELVVDFDMYNIPGSDEDVQLSYRAFQQAYPEIFWTPHNGGHWVATRADDIEAILRNPERFCSRHITVPRLEGIPPTVPLQLDPPRHAPIRRPLVEGLLPRVVNALEPKIRAMMAELIDGFRPRGECEFAGEFAQVVPIAVFLDLFDCPREDRAMLLPIADLAVRGDTNEKKAGAIAELSTYLRGRVTERRDRPGGDLLSQVVNAEYEGQRIDPVEAESYAATVLLAGLDTVAAMLSFIAKFLALNPAHRKQLVDHLDDEAFLRDAMEELLRRHGLANIARTVTRDQDYKGVALRAGDIILPPNLLVGLDERRVRDPLTVDFTRPYPNHHAAFGTGPHTCPGAHLARREVKLFLEEWLKRIPDFAIKPGTKPVQATGPANSVLQLELVWAV